MSVPDAETTKKMHRFFAVEANNRAWDLVEKSEPPSEAERDELLNNVHAAAFHWAAIGEPIHRARAEMLIAHAQAILGNAEAARHYARRCHAFCEGDDESITAWDRAFTTLEMAFAAGVAGDHDASKRFMEQAQKAGESVPDDDRGHLEGEIAKVEARLAGK